MTPDPRRGLFRGALAALVFLAVATAATSIVQSQRHVRSLFTKDAEEIARAFASSAVDALHRLDIRALRVHLAGLRGDPDVTEAYVTDANGAVLTDGTMENAKRDKQLTGPFGAELLRSRRWMSAFEDDLLHVGGPVEAADGTVLGLVVLKFSPASASILATSAGTAGVAALCLILGVGILWVVYTGQTRAERSSAARAQPATEPESDEATAASEGVFPAEDMERHRDAEEERTRLEEEREALESERRKVEEDRAAAEQLWAQAEEDIERVREERERYENRLEELSAEDSGGISGEEVERLNANVQGAEERAQKAEEECARTLEKCETAEGARKEAEESLEQARADAEKTRQKLDEARGEVEQARREAAVPAQAEGGAAKTDEEHLRLLEDRMQLEHSLKQVQEERELLAEELEKTRSYWKEQEGQWKEEKEAAVFRAESMPDTVTPAAMKPSADLESEAVLDKAEALAGVDGDMDFLKALIDVFMESSSRQLAEIRTAIERRDPKALERTARMVKGVVGTFGARAAATAALQLETIGIVGDLDCAEQAFVSLDAEIERLRPALSELAAESSG